MTDSSEMSEYERNSIFTQWAHNTDRVEVRRKIGPRQYKYLGRIARDSVEQDPGVVGRLFGGGLYRLQIIYPGNKYGRSIEFAIDEIAFGPPRDQ